MNPVQKVVHEINKKYKQEIITLGPKHLYVERIPFSSPRANYMTYGGIPVGKATEILGPENGGKTTTALDIVANAQRVASRNWNTSMQLAMQAHQQLKEKNNKVDQKEILKLEEQIDLLNTNGAREVAYFDSENTLDEDWAEINGVDLDLLYIARPQDHTAEQVLQMMLDLIDSDHLLCLVLDSIPMLVPQQIYEADLEKKSYAGASGPLSEFSKKVSGKISQNHTALVLINQVREDLVNTYNMYKTPGGRALKHLYSLRLFCRKGSLIDIDNSELKQSAAEPAGNLVDITLVKTKIFKPNRRLGFYTLNYNSGIDVLADTVDMAIKYDLLRQAGAWFYIIEHETGDVLSIEGEPLKFQGKAKLLEFLRDDTIVFNEIYQKVHALVTSSENNT